MLKSYLIVFFISMLPLIELRGAIPVGIGMGLPILPRSEEHTSELQSPS